MSLPDLHFALESHLRRIERLFKPGAKITLVVRNPDYGDAGVLLTKDDLDEVVKEIRLRQSEITDEE